MNNIKSKRWKLSVRSILLASAATLWVYSSYQYYRVSKNSTILNSRIDLTFGPALVNATNILQFQSYTDVVTISNSTFAALNSDLFVKVGYQVSKNDESWHDDIQKTLKAHPIHRLGSVGREYDIVDTLVFLAKSPKCIAKPIFVSMAHVGSASYWQLIENFVYTMLKFGLNDCALMICVNDEECMRVCLIAHFPCYHFRITSSSPSYSALSSSTPSVMEQIAHLKLYYFPQALSRGVNVMVILDLDVGFISNPMLLLEDFMNNDGSALTLPSKSSLPSSSSLSSYDIFVQQDLTFIMDRTVEKWKTWYISFMPNIGIMALKGNNNTRVIRLFYLAWKDYQTIKKAKMRNQPGKDQNKVVKAMETLTRQSALKWGYFNSNATILLDKFYKFHDTGIELGGSMAEWILTTRSGGVSSGDSGGSGRSNIGTIAAHATCFEQSSKVMGLKSVNAFWNPYYYNASRRTLTKKLIFIDKTQLIQKIRTLFYLAALTNRSLILPNILGKSMKFTPTHRHDNFKPYHRGNSYNYSNNMNINNKRLKITVSDSNSASSSSATTTMTDYDQWLWPGFRLASVNDDKNPYYSKSSSNALLLNVEVLEPAFY